MAASKISAVRWDIAALLLLFLFSSLVCLTQNEQQGDSSLTNYIELEREPVPLNLDSIRNQIGYPDICRDAGIEGKVVLHVMLDESGKYVKHLVIKTPHKLLSEAVEKHISGLRCTQAMFNSKPVKTWITIPFTICALHETGLQPIPLNLDSIRNNIICPEICSFFEIEGWVILRILIDEQGKYVQHLVLKQPHPALLYEVEKHISHLRYTPAYVRDKPIRIWVTLPITVLCTGD